MNLALFAFASSAFIFTAASTAIAQQPGVNLPILRTVAVLAESESVPASAYLRPTPEPTERHVEVTRWYKRPDNQVAIVLAAAETLDGIGTHENMTHRHWLCGYDPNLGSAYRINGAIYQAKGETSTGLIATMCGPSPFGSNENYAADTIVIDGSFTEGGWAAKYVNNRNYTGVELLNIGLDTAGLLAGRLIPGMGKMRWVKAAITALNCAHAVGHFYYGAQNIQFVHSPNQAANHFFESRPDPAFYTAVFPGPRWWGKQ